MIKSKDVRVPQIVTGGHGPRLLHAFGRRLPRAWTAVGLPDPSTNTAVASITLEMRRDTDEHQMHFRLPIKACIRTREDLEAEFRRALTPSVYRLFVACFAAVEEDYAHDRESYGTFRYWPARMLDILGGARIRLPSGRTRHDASAVRRIASGMDTLARLSMKVDMQMGSRRIALASKQLIVRNDSMILSAAPAKGRQRIERVRLAENLIDLMSGPNPIYVAIPPAVIRCPVGVHEARWSEAFMVYVELLSNARRSAARSGPRYALALDRVAGALHLTPGRVIELAGLLSPQHLAFERADEMIRYALPSAAAALDRIAATRPRRLPALDDAAR